MFTDRDLELWQKSLSGKGTTFEISRKDLEGLLERMKAAEAMNDYAAHETGCILTYWEAGEPTPDGGYKTKYAGKWYESKPINKEPKCNCGLRELDETWTKNAGK